MRLEPDGTLTVITGSTPHGQGHQTTWAQIAAEKFGVPVERVRVVFGDTDQPAYAVGTFGSRSAAVSGATVFTTADRLASQLRSLAATAFEAEGAMAWRCTPVVSLCEIKINSSPASPAGWGM